MYRRLIIAFILIAAFFTFSPTDIHAQNCWDMEYSVVCGCNCGLNSNHQPYCEEVVCDTPVTQCCVGDTISLINAGCDWDTGQFYVGGFSDFYCGTEPPPAGGTGYGCIWFLPEKFDDISCLKDPDAVPPDCDLSEGLRTKTWQDHCNDDKEDCYHDRAEFLSCTIGLQAGVPLPYDFCSYNDGGVWSNSQEGYFYAETTGWYWFKVNTLSNYGRFYLDTNDDETFSYDATRTCSDVFNTNNSFLSNSSGPGGTCAPMPDSSGDSVCRDESNWGEYYVYECDEELACRWNVKDRFNCSFIPGGDYNSNSECASRFYYPPLHQNSEECIFGKAWGDYNGWFRRHLTAGYHKIYLEYPQWSNDFSLQYIRPVWVNFAV